MIGTSGTGVGDGVELTEPVGRIDGTELSLLHEPVERRDLVETGWSAEPGGQLDDVREVVTTRGLHALEDILHVAVAEITHLFR